MRLPDKYCKSCPDRDTCKTPCAKVKKDLQRIHVGQKEIPVSTLCSTDGMYNYIIDSHTAIWKFGDWDWYKCVAAKKKYKLTDKQFEILRLYEVEGYSIVDIAKEMGVSRQAIYKSKKIIDSKINGG